jgi:peptidyl-prolyl cis-trans isomerase A (cyclophilin A)
MKKHALAFAALAGLCFAVWAANPTVTLDTSLGEIVVELNADKAPKTTENFIHYVKDGHYDGTIFHRVIDGFMIQGGGFDDRMNQKPTRPPIENEAKNGLRNLPGTLAMARTSDPHSASNQFFINLVANRSLDHPSPDGWGYAVFGRVVRGMEVVEKIAKVPTTDIGFHQNVPATPVVIRSARLNEAAAVQDGGNKTDKR